MKLIKMETEEVLATGIKNVSAYTMSSLRARGFDVIAGDELILTDKKIVIIDNYNRGTVSDVLWAQCSNLSDEDWELFNRAVNFNNSPDFYKQVGVEYELYEGGM